MSSVDDLSNEVFVSNDDGLDRFCKLNVKTSNKLATIKNVCSSWPDSFSWQTNPLKK